MRRKFFKKIERGGLDYKHGTGHGVGAYLNVHEKGVLLSFKYNPTGLKIGKGMVISNEVSRSVLT